MDKETAEALTRTKALYDAGVLTEAEYSSKKNELLHAPAVVVAQPPAAPFRLRRAAGESDEAWEKRMLAGSPTRRRRPPGAG